MSGAGRSTAANALEDLGWYVVDNLPPQMLKPLLDLTELAGGSAAPGRRRRRRARPRPVRGSSRGDAGAARAPADPRDVPGCLGRRARPPVRGGAPARTRCRATARSSTASGSSATRLAAVRESADIIIDTSSLQHPSAGDRGRRAVHRTRARPGTPLTIRASASSTGCRPTPTSSPTCASCPNPFWNEELRAAHRRGRRRARLRARAGRGAGVHRRLRGGAATRCSRATSARTSGTRSSRSAAPAASIARS